MRSHSLLLTSILPVGAAVLAIVFRALHRKSRTAVFLLIAVLPVVVGGLLRILITLVTCGLGSIIGLIEGIIYLTKTDPEFYQIYMVERRAWF